MARNVYIMNDNDNDIMLEKLNERINSAGNNKWILFALILLLIVIATIIVPVILAIYQTYHHYSTNQTIPEIIPLGTIVLTLSTAVEKKQTKNESQEMSSYMDKILKIVERLIEHDDNHRTTYIIEEFNKNVTFGRVLSKTEVIGELERIFNDTKSTSDINMTNAIELFHKIPCSSQITNILFVPDETMYSNQKIYDSDMKSAKDLLKQTAIENSNNAHRIIIGNPEYFQDINGTVSAYSSDMNIDELIEAILPALKVEEFMMPENLSTTTVLTKEDSTISSNIAETLPTDSLISSTIHEEQMTSEGLSVTTISTKEDTTISSNIAETLPTDSLISSTIHEEQMTSEGLSIAIVSTKNDTTVSSNITETLFINSWTWNTTDEEPVTLEDLLTTAISTNEDITAETLSINSWTWNTTHVGEEISSIIDENINSTTTSSDLSESIDCLSTATFVSYSKANLTLLVYSNDNPNI